MFSWLSKLFKRNAPFEIETLDNVYKKIRNLTYIVDKQDCSNKTSMLAREIYYHKPKLKWQIIVMHTGNGLHAVLWLQEYGLYDPTWGSYTKFKETDHITIVKHLEKKWGTYRFAINMEDLSAWGEEFKIYEHSIYKYSFEDYLTENDIDDLMAMNYKD